MPAYDCSKMPTIRAFLTSDAFIRGLVGPLGSGKSSAAAIEIASRGVAMKPSTDGVRRSRWAVIRNTAKQLEDTTERTMLQWFPPQQYGQWTPSKHNYTIKALRAPGDDKNAEIEILFRALDRPDQISDLLSLELTGGWVNEAREVPWPVIDALQGRVGRYPRRADAGDYWSGIWLDTNPPDVDSDFYKFFEVTDHSDAVAELAKIVPGLTVDTYRQVFKQPSGTSPLAENLENLQEGYYQRIAIGKSDEWVKVFVDGQYGFTVDGKPVWPEYNDALHCPADKRLWPKPVAGLPIVRSWDFGLCYSDDTEVLTDGGWKLFKDVDEHRDLAYSRDPATGKAEFQPINFKVARPYRGEMLRWDGYELNMCVTPEHRVPYTRRDTPNVPRVATADWLAANMQRHHYVNLTSEWEPEFEEQSYFGMPSEAWAAFLGIYLAEGSADRKRVVIYQNHECPEIARILANTRLPWKYSKYATSNGDWRIHDRVLGAHLAELGVAKTKRVPAYVRNMPRGHLLKFIEAYTLGDGHIRTRANGSVEHTIFTTSAEMAGDLQEIAQKIGWNSSQRIVAPQRSVITEGGLQRVIENTGGYSIAMKKRAPRAEIIKETFSRIAYDGMVYCLNVPWHTLYVRRKGRPHWNGNSPSVVFSQITPKGQWIVFDEIIGESIGADQISDAMLDHSARNYPGFQFQDFGDPAGQQRAQTDEKTNFMILHAKAIWIEPAIQTLEIRLESVRRPLRTLVDGKPQFVLHPRCSSLRRALMGGYHFRRLRISGERYTSSPEKDVHSHVADALGYAGTRLFGVALWQPQGRLPDHDPRAGVREQSRSRVTGY